MTACFKCNTPFCIGKFWKVLMNIPTTSVRWEKWPSSFVVTPSLSMIPSSTPPSKRGKGNVLREVNNDTTNDYLLSINISNIFTENDWPLWWLTRCHVFHPFFFMFTWGPSVGSRACVMWRPSALESFLRFLPPSFSLETCLSFMTPMGEARYSSFFLWPWSEFNKVGAIFIQVLLMFSLNSMK